MVKWKLLPYTLNVWDQEVNIFLGVLQDVINWSFTPVPYTCACIHNSSSLCLCTSHNDSNKSKTKHKESTKLWWEFILATWQDLDMPRSQLLSKPMRVSRLEELRGDPLLPPGLELWDEKGESKLSASTRCSVHRLWMQCEKLSIVPIASLPPEPKSILLPEATSALLSFTCFWSCVLS